MATRRAEIRQSRQQSRERIIAAATELVRRTSYSALTVDDVMREAGAGRTIFYRHFDDLADLLRLAGREAFNELFEAEQAFQVARTLDGPEMVRAAIEPAVAVYERHGPLLRAISEAAADDELIAAGQQAMRERFDELVVEALRDSPRLADRPAAELAEMARALNLMNQSYLMDAFGREPRVPAATAVRTLTEIWVALMHPPGGEGSAADGDSPG